MNRSQNIWDLFPQNERQVAKFSFPVISRFMMFRLYALKWYIICQGWCLIWGPKPIFPWEIPLFSIDCWNVQWAISPLVPWRLVAHFVRTGLICDAIWENLSHGENLIFWVFSIDLKDFYLLFLKLVKFCLYDTYIQSYVLSKLIRNREKYNNFQIILFISAKLPCATCGKFPRSHRICYALPGNTWHFG